MTTKLKSKPHKSFIDPHAPLVYVCMHSLTEDGASILALNTPLRDEVKSHYQAVIELDDAELRSRNSVLWIVREAKVETLLKPALKHVSDGHFNNWIRDTLVRICESEHWPELGAELRTLPDRESLGNIECWVMSAINLWGSEMYHWWGAMRVLRIDAAKWAMARLVCDKCRGEVWEISCPKCGKGE